jgi:hypothetical protein
MVAAMASKAAAVMEMRIMAANIDAFRENILDLDGRGGASYATHGGPDG